MSFFISLLYIAISVLSPDAVLPALAPYHVELWLAGAAVLSSLPAALDGRVVSVAQAGLLLAVTLGLVASFVWSGWFGGIAPALSEFIPSAIVFYFVVINFGSIGRLRLLALVLVLISLYFVVRGGIAYVGGNPSDPMIFAQWNDDNTAWFPRMRAFGFLNDPNDLAQFLITVAPFLWLQWRAKRFLMNACRVLLPAAVLLLGVFLTHSRGAIIAMVAVLLFAFKDSIGRTRSIILAVLAFVAMQVFNFSGGRTLSMGAGTDRIDAWSAGLEMFRSSPIFGVGYKQFFESYGAQAHNSFIHCAAELGFFGYFFWMALIVFSMSDLGTLANRHLTQVDDLSDSPPAPQPRHIARPSEATTTESESSASTVTVETVTHDESVGGGESETLRRLAILLRISFVGYLAAAFFLSRAYTITLFVLLGMAATLKLIAISSGNFGRRQPSRRLYSLTAQISVASLALIYIIVRIHWLR